MLKNVQESQNPLFKNSIKMEKQEKTCCFHLFRISKILKLETRDLHSLKDLFKSFPMVIYFSYFEENEEWFLKALRSASFFFERLSRKKSNRRFKIFSYPEETSFSIFRANHFGKVEQKSELNEPTNETYRCETSVCHGCPPKI